MDTITVENCDNGVTIFTINRPQKRNALNSQTVIELQKAFEEFDRSESQRVAIITGAGNEAFSSGADINDIPELWRCLPNFGVKTSKPIIAAVSGWCIGGGLIITMMSDLAVAAENSLFSYPEGKLGLTQGMIAGLVSRVSHKEAMEIMLWGLPVTALRAYEMGLINRVVPNGTHVKEAIKIAEYIATLAPKVLHTLKKHVNAIVQPSPAEAYIRTQIDLVDIEKSVDFQEGKSAFLEKRQPVFQNK